MNPYWRMTPLLRNHSLLSDAAKAAAFAKLICPQFEAPECGGYEYRRLWLGDWPGPFLFSPVRRLLLIPSGGDGG